MKGKRGTKIGNTLLADTGDSFKGDFHQCARSLDPGEPLGSQRFLLLLRRRSQGWSHGNLVEENDDWKVFVPEAKDLLKGHKRSPTHYSNVFGQPFFNQIQNAYKPHSNDNGKQGASSKGRKIV